ncbi:hypothetical protein DSO57_1014545 [Entomophthora muscae]|uniref:Uncharacterized protein n=1 Tax=Entomophthora muscae TaxID=34485 RepID=A0ACC2SUH6_9FUNG|nr:hypothetical protein DSO57_1014545 [Entomophthora muscae]
MGALPARSLASPRLVRWSLAAKEIIFINPLFSAFFAAGQTIPIIRGAGIYQPAMDAALELLDKSGWINIYPEGKVNRDKPLLPFKWGVGRLIQETASTPIIIPIYHSGMLNIYPGDGVILPRLGKQLVVSVGSPINIRELLKDDAGFQNISPDDTDRARSYITNIVRMQLDDLREETLAWMQEKGIDSGFRPNK